MTTKRNQLLMAAPLAAGILLATAGFAMAQDPNSGAPAGGMMGNLSADQLQKMRDLHDEMLASGRCDPADMAELHQDRSSR